MEYSVKNENGEQYLTIIFPPEYRNNVWANEFGEIQHVISNIIPDILRITFDFSNCIWVDPLPLLSLLLTISEIKNSLEKKIIFPKIGDNSNKSDKVLAFLHTEGFIEQFINNKVEIYNEGVKLNESDFKKYENLKSCLNYSDCTIIKAFIQNLNEITQNGSTIDKWVNKTIEEKKYDIKNKVDSISAEEVMSRLRCLLSETINNVYEHAYDANSPKKNVAFYVRFRNGLGNNKVRANERYKLLKLFNDEHESSPKLTRFFIDNIFNFIEIFVIDNGKGLSVNYIENIQDVKYPFRQAWQKALIEGKRGLNSKNKNTEFGGLYSISRYLGNNYICARDENEWMGTSLPCKDDVHIGTPIDSKKQIKGLSIIYRLTWNVAADDVEGWNYFATSEHSILERELVNGDDIYSRFYKKRLSEFLKRKEIPFYIKDNRFFNTKEILEKLYKLNEEENTNSGFDFCIYLPEIGIQKNEICENVNSFDKFTVKSKTLIIADILTQEANLFQLAIEWASFSENFCLNFDKIILITRRLHTFVLQKTERNRRMFFAKANDITQKNYATNKPTSFSPQTSLSHLIAWLKTHDSLLFWMNIQKKNFPKNDLYVNNKIKWYGDDGAELDMHGYLNFAQTLTDSLSKNIYEICLTRTLCLSNGFGCTYENMDVLTDRLSSKMNSLFYNEKDSNKTQKILLGSVIVSGLSQRSTKKMGKAIHFFRHGGIKNQSTTESMHLILWPEQWLKQIFPETAKDYRRVGRSHVIAPYGWKYYPIPRYRLFDTIKEEYVSDYTNLEQKDKYEFHCAYECTPSKTYNEIQVAGKQAVEIGHFHYENQHDLFKIDFPMLINNSFNENGKLCQFLLSEFLMALGNDSSMIDEKFPNQLKLERRERTRLTSEILTLSVKKLKELVQNRIDKSPKLEECALIVYPYHYATEHIIDLIKSYISPDLHDRIIALIPVTKERSGSSFLISPLTFEAVREKIRIFKAFGKEPHVLLFDEVIVSGKTRKELKHLLFHLGAKEVRTLCIVDRRRLPFSTTDPTRHKAYWRLDIPRLGNKDNCLICKALEKAENLENNLINKEERVSEWKRAWDNVFPYSKVKEHGLISKPLQKSIVKKFSLYINRETGKVMHNDSIELINSIGTSIYSCEIHSMTSRDDIALDMSNLSELDSLSVIELLCVNLLLYGKEFSNLVVEKMVKKIFLEINKSCELTNETALAALTLLIQDQSIIEPLYAECKQQNERDITINNYDLELLLCYFAQNEQSKFAESHKLMGHLKSNVHNIIKTNKLFHSEIYNQHGKVHNTPLQKIDVMIEDSEYKRNDFIAAQNSCGKILFLLDKLPHWHANSDIEVTDMISKIKDSIGLLKDEIQKFVEKKEMNVQSSVGDDIFKVTQKLKQAFNLLKKCHSYFFVNDNNLRISLEQVIHSQSEYSVKIENEIERSPEITNWINWDSQIINKVKYIVDNCKHANKKKIIDEDGLEYDMKIKIEYDKDHLRLIFLNQCEHTLEFVIDRTSKKKKPEKQHIRELAGDIYYNKISETILQTTIKLPYI